MTQELVKQIILIKYNITGAQNKIKIIYITTNICHKTTVVEILNINLKILSSHYFYCKRILIKLMKEKNKIFKYK